MLLELRVENYAVIDNVVVEFAPGLNLLTGETGAGKSILIDAFALLLGAKASPDVVRHGAGKAVVSAVVDAGPEVEHILERHGLDMDGDGLILRREIAAEGKGRVFVNNQPAAVAVLRELAPHVGTIHAQNETLLAFAPPARLALLDAFAGIDTAAVAAAFRAWRELAERIAELESDEQERLRMLDLWSFQWQEIEAARLSPGEDERLESERHVLANAEKIYGAAMAAFDVLYENDSSAASDLRSATRFVAEMARFDERFREAAASLESARLAVEDVAAGVRDYAGGIDASPERLAEIEDRLAALDRLKRKYGRTLDEVIAYGAELARKRDEMENKDAVVRRLQQESAAAAGQFRAAAVAASRQRKQAAARLEKQVEEEINALAMQARFRVEVSTAEEEAAWSEAGMDSVEYRISANPGEPLKPLEQIASGGELSRVMLALKATVEAAKGRAGKRSPAGQRTLVFDEIDTGIGGSAAEAVGRKLKQLARGNQVLCVTHLPQIASFADQHYAIEKRHGGGRVRTAVRRLGEAERREEIARMLSGATLTEASRRHAEALLKANA